MPEISNEVSRSLSEYLVLPGWIEESPEKVSLRSELGPILLQYPFMTARMQSVVGPKMAVSAGRNGILTMIPRSLRDKDKQAIINANSKARLKKGDIEFLPKPESVEPGCTVEDTIKFARKCHEYGIKVVFSTLVGLPIANLGFAELARKTDDQIKLTVGMFEKLLSLDSRHRGLMFLYCPYPGTPLYQEALKLGFKEPRSLEEWGNFSLYERHTPWITREQEFFVPMLSSYIFMFLDSDTIGWVKERIKSPIKKALFVAAFMVLSVIARWRWKHKIFSFAVDYRLFLFAKSRNKSI